MKTKWRPFIFGLILVSFTFLIGFANEYHWPRLKTWLLVELEELSNEHLPTRILARDLEFQFWPFGVKLKNLKVLPKGELAKTVAPMRFQSISIHPGFLGLFSGHLRLSSVRLEKPEITIIAKAGEETSTDEDSSKGPKFDLEKVFSLPISELDIQKMQLQLLLEGRQIVSQINDLDFGLRLDDPHIFVNMKTPRIVMKKSGQEPRLSLSVNTRFSVSKDGLQLSSLQLQKGNSFVIASGQIDADTETLTLLQSDIKARSFFDLPSLYNWAKTTFPDLELPKSDGQVEVDLKMKKVGSQPPQLDFNLKTKKLALADYQVGDILFSGTSDLKSVRSEKMSVTNNSGTFNFKNLDAELKAPYKIKSVVNADGVELSRFLETIKVPEVPVQLYIFSELPCEGQLSPKFNLDCEGWLEGRKLRVSPEVESEKTIVAVNYFKAQGKTNVTAESVRYEAALTMADDEKKGGASKGRSTGHIIYDKGFDIRFNTPELDFKNVKDLSGLLFSGKARLNGYTRGDSNRAILFIKTKAKNFSFQNYGLGNFTTDLSYKAGILKMRKIKGQIGDSRYEGHSSINLIKEQLFASIQLPFANAADLHSSIRREIPIPFSLSGTGSGEAKVWGPLVVNRLSYDAQLNLFRGAFGLESYDSLTIDVTSRNGHLKSNKVLVTKGQSQMTLTGKGRPNGQIETTIVGRKLRLEDSELAQAIGFNLQGRLDFDVKLNGLYYSPTTALKGKLTEMKIGSTLLEPSIFELNVDEKQIRGQGSLFGNDIHGRFAFPIQEGEEFALNLTTKNWNFIPFFGLYNETIEKLDYKSNLSGKINLQASKGGFWKSSGSLVLDDFLLTRGKEKLQTRKKMSIRVKDGLANAKNLELNGENSFVKSEVKNSSERKFDAAINGQFDLSLISFLTPFFEDISGPASFSFKVGGSRRKPELLGSIYLENGFIKLHDIPHPIEKIKADILLSQSKLLINSALAEFASGNVEANGQVEFKSLSSFPTNISVVGNNLDVSYPEKIRTRGDTELKVTGDWFPFLVSGTGQVSEMTIESEFSQDDKKLKSSPFLPELILRKEFHPFEFDIAVDVPKEIKIKNSLLDSSFKGKVQVRGNNEFPRLEGDLQAVKGGRLFFRKTPFEISEANVRFRNLDPMNPILFFTAETHVDDFDISFLLQGPSQKPDIQLTSQPTLAENDIISLLALGITSTDLDEKVEDQEQVTRTIIGSAINQSVVGQELKDKFGLSLQFSQAFDDEQGSIEKITVRKQVGKKLEASASRASGKDEVYDVKVEYKINKNFSVIGSWEGKNSTEATDIVEEESDNGNNIGLDLEYKVEFE